MELSFVVFTVIFAVIYVVLAMVRTVRRQSEIVFSDILLAFFIALIALSGLIINGMNGESNTRVGLSVLITAGVLAVFGVIFTIREWFRPQRLEQSRGILTLGVSALLALASFLVPFAAAYFSLSPQSTAPVAQVREQVTAAQSTADASQEFFVVFNQVIDVVADASGLSQDEVLTALDGGQTVAQLIETNKGDLEQVIDEITRIMQDFVRSLVTQQRVDPLRASAGIAGMEIVVRYAINNDLSTLQRAGEENNDSTPLPTAEGTSRQSFFAFLTASFTPSGTDVNPALSSVPVSQTPFPSVTPPPDAEPSATRTPRPTATITPTRERFVTRTPTLTPILPSPCLIQMEYNVNMRTEPDTNSTLVTTIPFDTVVNAFGRTEDSNWWFVEYEGDAGWVSAEFVTATSSCSRLAVRD